MSGFDRNRRVEKKKTAPSPKQEPQTTGSNSAVIDGMKISSAHPPDPATFLSNLDHDATAGTSTAPAAADAQATENAAQHHKTAQRPDGKLGRVWDANAKRNKGLEQNLTPSLQRELQKFQKHYKANQKHYDKIAKGSQVPAPLAAALHWREASGDFTRYLHQGDKLGKPAVHVPKNIPVFHDFDKAATHALNMKSGLRDKMNMDEHTTDPTAIATYAEAYNGLGYHNRKQGSPYVYSGTKGYSKGKYVKDGKFSKNTVDKQIGVMTMVGSVGGLDGFNVDSSKTDRPEPKRPRRKRKKKKKKKKRRRKKKRNRKRNQRRRK